MVQHFRLIQLICGWSNPADTQKKNNRTTIIRFRFVCNGHISVWSAIRFGFTRNTILTNKKNCYLQHKSELNQLLLLAKKIYIWKNSFFKQRQKEKRTTKKQKREQIELKSCGCVCAKGVNCWWLSSGLLWICMWCRGWWNDPMDGKRMEQSSWERLNN